MANFLLVDAANLMWRAAHVTRGNSFDRVGLAAHIMLNSLPFCMRKFEIDHVVFCYEGRSWRKDFDSSYKLNRKVTESKRTKDEQEFVEIMMEMQEDMKNFITNSTNSTVLQHRNLEADDLVAGWIKFHPDDNHVILSSDSDFRQLISKNVTIYDAIDKTIYKIDEVTDINGNVKKDKLVDPEYYLFEKIIRGDTSDNIKPSYPGVRKKGTKNKVGILEAFEDRNNQGFAWNTFMNEIWTDEKGLDHVVKDTFNHNKLLIDLNAQPEFVKEMIIETIGEVYKEKKKVSQIGIKFIKFCGKYFLTTLANSPDPVTKMLAKGL